MEPEFGTNPYRFGMIGSTDAHTALQAIEEDNFFSKAANVEPSPKPMEHPFAKTDQGVSKVRVVASGLTAVWPEENTRASIWEAMNRKEVYGTTGPRIGVRFLAAGTSATSI